MRRTLQGEKRSETHAPRVAPWANMRCSFRAKNTPENFCPNALQGFHHIAAEGPYPALIARHIALQGLQIIHPGRDAAQEKHIHQHRQACPVGHDQDDFTIHHQAAVVMILRADRQIAHRFLLLVVIQGVPVVVLKNLIDRLT